MNEVAKPIDQSALRRLVIGGDLSKLTIEQRDEYYVALCDALRIDWKMRPFDYIILNNKLQLYGNKNCAEQLRSVHKISIEITDKKLEDDIYLVTARANMSERHDEATGAVVIGNLKGEARANAIMKAETKAKRRVTLSIVGAGLLDETETETIPDAKKLEPKDITPTPDISAAQAEFERQKGITSEVKENPPAEQEPAFTPEQIAEAEAQRLKKEEGERRKARVAKMPDDVIAYFRAKGFLVGKVIAILDENEDDVERIRSYMKDNPVESKQVGDLAEHLKDERIPEVVQGGRLTARRIQKTRHNP